MFSLKVPFYFSQAHGTSIPDHLISPTIFRTLKKEGRLTTTIFTNLKSYTMKNTMQR